jgi:hypothetical protein
MNDLAIKIANHMVNKLNENINHAFIIMVSFSVFSRGVIIRNVDPYACLYSAAQDIN